jgi:hypothetical protein
MNLLFLEKLQQPHYIMPSLNKNRQYCVREDARSSRGRGKNACAVKFWHAGDKTLFGAGYFGHRLVSAL